MHIDFGGMITSELKEKGRERGMGRQSVKGVLMVRELPGATGAQSLRGTMADSTGKCFRCPAQGQLGNLAERSLPITHSHPDICLSVARENARQKAAGSNANSEFAGRVAQAPAASGPGTHPFIPSHLPVHPTTKTYQTRDTLRYELITTGFED